MGGSLSALSEAYGLSLERIKPKTGCRSLGILGRYKQLTPPCLVPSAQTAAAGGIGRGRLAFEAPRSGGLGPGLRGAADAVGIGAGAGDLGAAEVRGGAFDRPIGGGQASRRRPTY